MRSRMIDDLTIRTFDEDLLVDLWMQIWPRLDGLDTRSEDEMREYVVRVWDSKPTLAEKQVIFVVWTALLIDLLQQENANG